MTPDTLTDLEKLAEAATPGPWSYAADINRLFSVPSNLIVAAIHVKGNPASEAAWPVDAAYIAAFHPEVAKELIAEVRRLREIEKIYLERIKSDARQHTWVDHDKKAETA